MHNKKLQTFLFLSELSFLFFILRYKMSLNIYGFLLHIIIEINLISMHIVIYLIKMFMDHVQETLMPSFYKLPAIIEYFYKRTLRNNTQN